MFDAAIFCISQGFPGTQVYNWSPTTFGKVYQSLKRQEGQKDISRLYLINQACNGTTESIKEFTGFLGQWLSSKSSTSGDTSKYKAMLKGNKLVKGHKKNGRR